MSRYVCTYVDTIYLHMCVHISIYVLYTVAATNRSGGAYERIVPYKQIQSVKLDLGPQR